MSLCGNAPRLRLKQRTATIPVMEPGEPLILASPTTDNPQNPATAIVQNNTAIIVGRSNKP